ncbi:MAG: type 1 glutamine amidotransferase domain-containing protein [Clostridiales bacterium]|jgi:putative intracellular protease/amidase|nr:type 1 glutamine amidotransferase domain-containing protein [Clostridiales bacterium]
MKKILMVLSEYGYWGEELVAPLQVLENAGYIVNFATPTGKRPHALPPSMDSAFIDPPLDKRVVSPEMAEMVQAIEESDRLDSPLALNSLIPEIPYISSVTYLRDFEKYNNSVDKTAEKLSVYNALILVGGSGPIVDMVNNHRVHDVIRIFHNANKPIAAECYAVACLAFARDYWRRESIIKNKHVTGHCLEYDYHDGTGFYGVDFNMGPPPYPLEFILRDATAPNGQYIGNVGKNTSVIVDYPFITGRSTPDSYLTGEMLIKVIEEKMERYGW